MLQWTTRTRNAQFGRKGIFRKGGGATANIVLLGNLVREDAAPGAVIGALSSGFGTGPRTFSIQADPDSKFAVSGTNLVVRGGASFDYETKTFHEVTVRVTDALAATADVLFTIYVTDVLEIAGGVVFELGVFEAGVFE